VRQDEIIARSHRRLLCIALKICMMPEMKFYIQIARVILTTCFLLSFSSQANVFGKDDRVAFYPTAKPWTAIGKIITPQGICTGTLIGPSKIITAAHCVLASTTLGVLTAPQDIKFHPAFQAGVSKGHSWGVAVTLGTRFPLKEFWNDWAIVELAHPLGNEFGHMVPTSLHLKTKDHLVSLVGYSADFQEARNGSFQNTCYIKESIEIGYAGKDALHLHDCDMRGGASGGPVIGWIGGQPYIIAINVAQKLDPKTGGLLPDGVTYSKETANVAAPVYKAIMNLIR